MKLRIKGNSIRLRLSKSEVALFGENGYIEEKTEVGNNTLCYALKSYDGNKLFATFENNTITVLLPMALKKEWLDTERVGFEDRAGNLHLLLEKDFKCLDENIEDQSDNYDNPLFAK